ncbi:MAG: hypothetical protein GF311_04850 [Candidatus Lokiarchaeota archaeon]|nr:hypothetical protein [Candidatus Lokiarchaeota archaeon]
MSENIVKINEELYSKLEKLSNQIGISIEILINKELEKLLKIFLQSPLDALESIEYDNIIKEVLK